jgi:hypothetical protein
MTFILYIFGDRGEYINEKKIPKKTKNKNKKQKTKTISGNCNTVITIWWAFENLCPTVITWFVVRFQRI